MTKPENTTSLQPLNPSLESAIAEKQEAFSAAIVDYSLEGRRRDYPWRNRVRSAYEVLLAEVALKRTTATAVARVYLELLRRYPTPEHLNAATELEISQSLAPIGLQKQRARSLKQLASYITSKLAGVIPENLSDLLQIPGVGAYVARAVLAFAYDKPVAVLDSNVKRILGRVFFNTIPKHASDRVYQAIADELLPAQRHRDFNFGMLDLGALICRPVPQCQKCPLHQMCDYHCNVQHNEWQVREENQAQLSQLKMLRKAKGMSLAEIARRSGVSKLTIINIENGRTYPRQSTMAKLAKVLEVTQQELTSYGA